MIYDPINIYGLYETIISSFYDGGDQTITGLLAADIDKDILRKRWNEYQMDMGYRAPMADVYDVEWEEPGDGRICIKQQIKVEIKVIPQRIDA